MANDATLPVRRAMLTALKADAPMIALVPAADIHPQAPTAIPTWPFVKMGAPAGIPLKAACVDGNEITTSVHGFSKGRWSGNQLLEDAEDHAARIGSAIADALGGKLLNLDGGGKAKVIWTGSQLLIDQDEAGAFHSIQNFRVRVVT